MRRVFAILFLTALAARAQVDLIVTNNIQALTTRSVSLSTADTFRYLVYARDAASAPVNLSTALVQWIVREDFHGAGPTVAVFNASVVDGSNGVAYLRAYHNLPPGLYNSSLVAFDLQDVGPPFDIGREALTITNAASAGLSGDVFVSVSVTNDDNWKRESGGLMSPTEADYSVVPFSASNGSVGLASRPWGGVFANEFHAGGSSLTTTSLVLGGVSMPPVPRAPNDGFARTLFAVGDTNYYWGFIGGPGPGSGSQLPIGTNRTSFAYSMGSTNTFIVPAGITNMAIWLWGGAGGTGHGTLGRGGAGGFYYAELTVLPSEVYLISVGGGGSSASVGWGPNGMLGGVKSAVCCSQEAGHGGGASAVFKGTGTNYVLVAGGGGGGGGSGASHGGAGGYYFGQRGSVNSTTTAYGARSANIYGLDAIAGTNLTASYSYGSTNRVGQSGAAVALSLAAGGGGGYRGGAGGRTTVTNTTASGAGGCGFANSNYVSYVFTSLPSATAPYLPEGDLFEEYSPGVAVGAANMGVASGDGLCVIGY